MRSSIDELLGAGAVANDQASNCRGARSRRNQRRHAGQCSQRRSRHQPDAGVPHPRPCAGPSSPDAKVWTLATRVDGCAAPASCCAGSASRRTTGRTNQHRTSCRSRVCAEHAVRLRLIIESKRGWCCTDWEVRRGLLGK